MSPRNLLLLTCIFAISAIQTARCATGRHAEKEILDTILAEGNYDPRLRAHGNDTEPTVVTVNLFVRSIQGIDDVKMEYKVQLTFRMQWLDKRLIYSHLNSHGKKNQLPYLTLAKTSSAVWIPDLFFSNELEGHYHDLLTRNTYTRIFPDGQVLYSARLSLTLSCPMILKLFPLDKQTCSLRMASYGYTTQDLIFKWKDMDPVQVTADLHLPRFALEQFTTDYCDSHTNTGVYSCLRVDLLFKREFSYYLIQVFIPMTNLVIVAYLTFWIDRKDTTARLLFPLVTLLAMAAFTLLINRTFPAVSYTKAIDVWTGICLTFVFSALVVSVVTNSVGGGTKQQRGGSATVGSQDNTEVTPLKQDDKKAQMGISQKIDLVTRIVYPALFALFLICYGVIYGMKKDVSS